MDRRRILYLLTADRLASPFDVSMGHDAGFDAVHPYAGVAAEEVRGFTQDLMFARGPKGALATALFVTSSDLEAAEGMYRAAKKSLFDPFRIHLMVDPKGGYTTAAAVRARVRAAARRLGVGDLQQRSVVVLAGTGGVGRAAAALFAADGARVVLTSRSAERAAAATRSIGALFKSDVEGRAISSERDLSKLIDGADVVFAAGAAGVQLVPRSTLDGMAGPKIFADVNAVPPAGIEGLEPKDDGREIGPGLFGIGPLAVGELKNKVEAALLREMATANSPCAFDLQAARLRAEEILAGS